MITFIICIKVIEEIVIKIIYLWRKMRLKRKYEINSEDINYIKEHDNPDEFVIKLNENIPYLVDDDKKQLEGNVNPFSDLDNLNRCGVAFACISNETLSNGQGDRSSIKSKPTGFFSKNKNFINGKYIFQRCHLIGHQLLKKENDKKNNENVNKINLFIGTRLMNHEMLYFENLVVNYVRDTGNHVLYRVTPYFEGDNKLVYGVQMEAKSINDKNTNGLLFNVFVYNKQPCIKFEYETGIIFIDKSKDLSKKMLKTERKYIINEKNKRFHLENCASVYDIKSMKEVTKKGEDLIQEKYCPCGICIPY